MPFRLGLEFAELHAAMAAATRSSRAHIAVALATVHGTGLTDGLNQA